SPLRLFPRAIVKCIFSKGLTASWVVPDAAQPHAGVHGTGGRGVKQGPPWDVRAHSCGSCPSADLDVPGRGVLLGTWTGRIGTRAACAHARIVARKGEIDLGLGPAALMRVARSSCQRRSR